MFTVHFIHCVGQGEEVRKETSEAFLHLGKTYLELLPKGKTTILKKHRRTNQIIPKVKEIVTSFFGL